MSSQLDTSRVLVVGAGIGGLACAALLARAGLAVTVLEAAPEVGGKMQPQRVAGRPMDAGPTVFTMRWVFEELFDALGARLDDELVLRPANVLARHHWDGGPSLDLLASREASCEAIAAFAGGDEARRYARFCERAGRMYDALEPTFLRAQRPRTPLHLSARFGLRGLPRLAGISPFSTLWSALSQELRDPRLRQLFGRYATYCGSSPFLAPATLMLVAHVEQSGVWLVEGGMAQLPRALAAQARRLGVQIRTGCAVRSIDSAQGRARGVLLENGEYVAASSVVFNGDVAALQSGLLGTAPPGMGRPQPRSLSAVTWGLAADLGSRALHRHTVFFPGDSRREFAELFEARRAPSDPTVYLCAQDRDADGQGPGGPERLFALANAPADALGEAGLQALTRAVAARLASHGLVLDLDGPGTVRSTPADFSQRYPGTGGALYGAASHGWRASFLRPGARTKLRGLYCAGGSAHPGPGVPMAALSGRLAAQALLEDMAR